MTLPFGDAGQNRSSFPYAKPAEWATAPSDEEVQEILEKLTNPEDVEVTERSELERHPSVAEPELDDVVE